MPKNSMTSWLHVGFLLKLVIISLFLSFISEQRAFAFEEPDNDSLFKEPANDSILSKFLKEQYEERNAKASRVDKCLQEIEAHTGRISPSDRRLCELDLDWDYSEDQQKAQGEQRDRSKEYPREEDKPVAKVEVPEDKCPLFEPKQNSGYIFMESSRQQSVNEFRDTLCDFIEGGQQPNKRVIDLAVFRKKSKRFEHAASLWSAQMTWAGYCNTGYYDKVLNDTSVDVTVKRVFDKFCYDHVQTIELLSMDIEEASVKSPLFSHPEAVDKQQKFSKPYLWFRTELFCQTSALQAKPGGWRGMTKPDLPLFDRLEKSSDSLCDDVRKGTISVDEAQYRWDQKLSEAQRLFGPEVIQGVISYFSGILKSLVN